MWYSLEFIFLLLYLTWGVVLCDTVVGAFHVNIWRFGEWTETVVDDFLPILDGRLMFCPSFGDPPELWGAIVEKAYAK